MRIDIDKSIKYILMLLMFYSGQLTVMNYTMFSSASYSRLIMMGMFMVVMGIFAYYFVKCHKTINYVCILCGSMCIVNYILSMILNRDWRGSYVLLVMNILTAVSLTAIFDRREFYAIYVNCMVFFSVIGIIATYGIVPFLASYLPTVQASNGALYYNLVLVYPLSLSGAEAYRMNCIWTEPGVLAAYLMFALIFGLFFVKSGVVKNFILILAMLCARSSTGYVLLILIIGTFVLKQILDTHNFSLLIVIALSVIAAGTVVYMLMPDAVDAILYKYQINSIYFIGRIAPMIYNMDMWTRSPLFGLGFEEGAFRVNYKIYRGVLFANTSTTTLLFHNFGFVLPVMSMLASWRLSRVVRERWIISFLLAAILILGVNFENQVLDQFYCIILFSIFMPMKEEQENESAVA